MTAPLALPPGTRTHADATGFSLAVPEAWEFLDGVDDTTVLVAVEPDGPGARSVNFRANLVVTTSRVEGVDFDAWQRGSDVVLDRQLTGWVLLDLERLTVDGHPAVRRLGTYVAPDGAPVTLVQWAVLRGGEGLTLSVTVANAAWDALADHVTALGETFHVAPSRQEGPR